MSLRQPHLSSLIALAVWIGGACGWDQETPTPTDRPRGIAPAAAEEPAPQAEAPNEAPTKKAPTFDWDEFEKKRGGDSDKEEKDDDKPERDFAAELRNTVGSPVGCLEPRRAGPDAPSKITIALSAVVIHTGRITRGSATSAQLNAKELECIQKRLDRGSIPGNVEDAPRTITTTITLELKQPEKKDTDKQGEAPASDNGAQ